jgi:hypothetical protein
MGQFYTETTGNSRNQQDKTQASENRSAKPKSLARTEGAYRNRTGVNGLQACGVGRFLAC